MYVYRQLDSREQRPLERFDYWQSTVYPWTVELEACDSPNDYCADMRWIATPDGMHLQDSRANATRTRITPQRCRADYGDHFIGIYGLRRGRFAST